MQWFYINTSTLDSKEFLRSDPVIQATWLKLQRYCIGQENGGVIVGARVWSDQDWRDLTRATRKDVHRASALWEWAGDDLKVKFYPLAKEFEMQTKRRAAVATNAKRGAARDAPLDAARDAPPDAERDADLDTKVREEKEREEKREREKVSGGTLSLDLVLGFGRENGIAEGCCRKFWFRKKGQPGPDWQWELQELAISWGEMEKKRPGQTPGVNGVEKLADDDPDWWVDGLEHLESVASGLGLSGDTEKGRRLLKIIEYRKTQRR